MFWGEAKGSVDGRHCIAPALPQSYHLITPTPCPFTKKKARALEDDVADRREDAAKKRAVRTARSYDEFRHRVACAHLKPLGYVVFHGFMSGPAEC